ncbi:hypothetical protein PPERSA_09933 [Pseudocohnilembus persalinus]|uniref:Uncharacterized protein n=1 Tax=Pseudocohnilembus persalinus TaxID=266149 RepID=A0A0V0QJM3_PSEPJ|nr:hypothetical protein PPERSA_09933 [Pseudocohnilembus persalinus]|eukprot:KRX02316.1 hypothetical protein PPERSA_09933 [Pseudocohnilembus persalinus]
MNNLQNKKISQKTYQQKKLLKLMQIGDFQSKNLSKGMSQSKIRQSSYQFKSQGLENDQTQKLLPKYQPKQIMIRSFSMTKNQFPQIKMDNQLKNGNFQNSTKHLYQEKNKQQQTLSDYYNGNSDKQTNCETQSYNQTQSQFGMKTFYHTVQRGFFNNNRNGRQNTSQSVRTRQIGSMLQKQPSELKQSRTQQGFNTFLSPNDVFENCNQLLSSQKKPSCQLSRTASYNTAYNNLSHTNINNDQNGRTQDNNQRRNTQKFYDTYFNPIFKGDDMGGIQPNLPEGKSQLPDIDYKTQFDFKNTQQNQHLFFLNFMHDQNNPPKHQKNIEIPSEEEINQQFQFKISQQLQNFENPTSTINFLNSGWEKDFKLIEDYIDYAKKKNEELVQEKAGMQEQLDNIKQKYNNELEQLQQEFGEKMRQIPAKLQEDFIKHQNEQFRLNKEITKLNKDKNDLNTQIEQAYEKIGEIETQMFGFPIFQLESNDPNLDIICQMNLRSDIEAYKKTNYPKLQH